MFQTDNKIFLLNLAIKGFFSINITKIKDPIIKCYLKEISYSKEGFNSRIFLNEGSNSRNINQMNVSKSLPKRRLLFKKSIFVALVFLSATAFPL